MGLFDRFERFLDDVLFLPEDVREGLDAGDRALEAELFREAASIYRDVLESRPQLPRALVGLAHALRGVGDHAGTLEALEQARRVLPEDDELALWTARLALELDDADRAAAAARDAAQLRAAAGGPPLAEACALAATAEWRRGRPDRAARELRKALASDPSQHGLHVDLSYALADAGLMGAARSAAVAAPTEQLSPTQRRHLGDLLDRLGDPERGRALLESALAEGDPGAGLVLAKAAIRDGRLDDAELLGQRAVAAGLGAQALGVLGDALAAAGRFAEAAEALAAAAEAGDDDALDRALRVAPRATLIGLLERFGPRVAERSGEELV
ncbi:MAG: tetratricopeptide repeat protein, partial [Myxococcales bacterium]|nr:tetratricopeptide repeat protein [Myxococcales bacterium]